MGRASLLGKALLLALFFFIKSESSTENPLASNEPAQPKEMESISQLACTMRLWMNSKLSKESFQERLRIYLSEKGEIVNVNLACAMAIFHRTSEREVVSQVKQYMEQIARIEEQAAAIRKFHHEFFYYLENASAVGATEQECLYHSSKANLLREFEEECKHRTVEAKFFGLYTPKMHEILQRLLSVGSGQQNPRLIDTWALYLQRNYGHFAELLSKMQASGIIAGLEAPEMLGCRLKLIDAIAEVMMECREVLEDFARCSSGQSLYHASEVLRELEGGTLGLQVDPFYDRQVKLIHFLLELRLKILVYGEATSGKHVMKLGMRRADRHLHYHVQSRLQDLWYSPVDAHMLENAQTIVIEMGDYRPQGARVAEPTPKFLNYLAILFRWRNQEIVIVDGPAAERVEIDLPELTNLFAQNSLVLWDVTRGQSRDIGRFLLGRDMKRFMFRNKAMPVMDSEASVPLCEFLNDVREATNGAEGLCPMARTLEDLHIEDRNLARTDLSLLSVFSNFLNLMSLNLSGGKYELQPSYPHVALLGAEGLRPLFQKLEFMRIVNLPITSADIVFLCEVQIVQIEYMYLHYNKYYMHTIVDPQKLRGRQIQYIIGPGI